MTSISDVGISCSRKRRKRSNRTLRHGNRLKSHQACISVMYFVSVTKILLDIVEIDSHCADFRAFCILIISCFAKRFGFGELV